MVFVTLLKALFTRPSRPYFEHPLLLETYYSFPSGHAMEAVVLYGMLAYFAMLALRTWRAHAAVGFGASLLSHLIAIRRILCGFSPLGGRHRRRAQGHLRDQSISSASPRRSSSIRCRRSHSPVSCHSSRRRQQVMPKPQPSSRGKDLVAGYRSATSAQIAATVPH
jgi:hypothetical protein